jgi:hypothetical protein
MQEKTPTDTFPFYSNNFNLLLTKSL